MNNILAQKLFHKGLELFKNKKYDNAIKIFTEILIINPKNINSLVILSQIFKIKNNLVEYEKSLKRIIELDKNNFQSFNNLALLYKDLNFNTKAEFFFKKSIKANNKYVKAIFNLALLNEEMGNLRTAEDLYVKALSIEKNNPSIYFNLLRINSNFIKKINFKQIKHFCENENQNFKERAYANFILATKERRDKNIDKEIQYLENGHNLFFNSDNLYIKLNDYWINKIPKIFFSELKYSKKKNELNNTTILNPIFVIGLPRSGTTLVETLISSQKNKIKNCGETSVISQSVENFLSNKNIDNFEFNLSFLKKDIFYRYSKIISLNNSKPITFIDKTLENIFFLDLIKKIFPRSKVIICERNYFHNFVAIYQQCLAGLAWTHKKESIMKYIENYNLFLKKLKKKKDSNVLFVNLKELTNEPENKSKKILNFCNLEWDKSVLKFYERNDLNIKTASNIQIRKGISKYDDKKFEPYKKPFIKYLKKINSLNN